jgi:hypothetical protein
LFRIELNHDALCSILLTKTPATAIHIAMIIFEPSLMIHRMAMQWGAETMNGDRMNPKIV